MPSPIGRLAGRNVEANMERYAAGVGGTHFS